MHYIPKIFTHADTHRQAGDADAKLLAFVRDAIRLVSAFEGIIQLVPLQLYCSALVFSPSQSIVRQLSADQLHPRISGLPELSGEWSALLQVLKNPPGTMS